MTNCIKGLLGVSLMCFAIGCGGAVSEIPPTDEPGEEMPEEDVKNFMEESMKKGNVKQKMPTDKGGDK